MRINRFIATSGIASRRAAEDLIISKRVRVNGKIVTDMATQISDTDVVEVNGQKITPATDKIYIIMNKPRGCLTTCSDDRGRRTVLDLLPKNFISPGVAHNTLNLRGNSVGKAGAPSSSSEERGRPVGVRACGSRPNYRSDEEELLRQPAMARVFPVGRLDYNTEGLLLLTNDGDFAYQIIHPKNEIQKVYRAVVDSDITEEQLLELTNQSDSATQISPREIEIVIHEGKNRQIRKMLAAVGLEPTTLKRTAIGKLNLGRLKTGEIICLNAPPVI